MMDDECCNNGTCACNINPIVEPERCGCHHASPPCAEWDQHGCEHTCDTTDSTPTPECGECGGTGIYRGMNSRQWPCHRCTPKPPTPECNGDDNCIECCPEVEVSMPGTIAALTAELAQATDERDALLHVRHTLTAERDRYRDALERIANEDYRGNRPYSTTIAYQALTPIEEQHHD